MGILFGEAALGRRLWRGCLKGGFAPTRWAPVKAAADEGAACEALQEAARETERHEETEREETEREREETQRERGGMRTCEALQEAAAGCCARLRSWLAAAISCAQLR